jgi:hypothetical protein
MPVFFINKSLEYRRSKVLQSKSMMCNIRFKYETNFLKNVPKKNLNYTRGSFVLLIT